MKICKVLDIKDDYLEIWTGFTWNKVQHKTSPNFSITFKDALSGLTQFLAAERPLKMMTNAFYSTSKAIFVLKIFKFLS